MLALLSLLDLVYMLRSTLAATLLKIIALPVPLLRQVPLGSFWVSFFEVFFRVLFGVPKGSQEGPQKAQNRSTRGFETASQKGYQKSSKYDDFQHP